MKTSFQSCYSLFLCFAGDKVVTISMVLPTVLDLHSHLTMMKSKMRFCRAVVNARLLSLRKRFGGIFENRGMSNLLPCQPQILKNGKNLPFSEKVYLLSSALDPRFCFHWADIDLQVDPLDCFMSVETVRDNVKEHIKRKQSF